MMRAFVLTVLLLGPALTGGAAAGTVDGYPWPPPESAYEPAGTPVSPGLKVGDKISAENVDAAKELLPPEVVEHFKKGEYRDNAVVSWPAGIYHSDKPFEEATKANKGKYKLTDVGTIVDQDGKEPAYLYGFPFSDLKPDDADAGVKAVWNHQISFWANGNEWATTLLVWATPAGAERKATIDVLYQFYEEQQEQYRVPNPQKLLSQNLLAVYDPADLQGTAALSYRYKDATKRDNLWTYVPALRRVRSVSPSNRSDGFLGSDQSQDDGQFFDGKPEDFVWKTVGIREGLRVVEPESIRGRSGSFTEMGPDKGFRLTWEKNVPCCGFQLSNWKGVSWAPVNAAFAKRKMLVVEGVPRDRYYLYGKIELWIDLETFQGAWARKFGWKDELLNSYQVMAYLNYPATRRATGQAEWMWGSEHMWSAEENIKLNRATMVGIRASLDAPQDRRMKHNIEQTFGLDALSRHGK
ncbi:MAG: DUF1329 domain-containing protein [Candidatus Binatia bacterium]